VWSRLLDGSWLVVDAGSRRHAQHAAELRTMLARRYRVTDAEFIALPADQVPEEFP
jgi:hypothetical protein